LDRETETRLACRFSTNIDKACKKTESKKGEKQTQGMVFPCSPLWSKLHFVERKGVGGKCWINSAHKKTSG